MAFGERDFLCIFMCATFVCFYVVCRDRQWWFVVVHGDSQTEKLLKLAVFMNWFKAHQLSGDVEVDLGAQLPWWKHD